MRQKIIIGLMMLAFLFPIVSLANQAPIINSLNSDKNSPQNDNISIIFTINATDPDEDALLYQFWLRGSATNGTQIVKDWSPNNTWNWTPSQSNIGRNLIISCVRDGQHAGEDDYDGYKSTIFNIINPKTETAPKYMKIIKIDPNTKLIKMLGPTENRDLMLSVKLPNGFTLEDKRPSTNDKFVTDSVYIDGPILEGYITISTHGIIDGTRALLFLGDYITTIEREKGLKNGGTALIPAWKIDNRDSEVYYWTSYSATGANLGTAYYGGYIHNENTVVTFYSILPEERTKEILDSIHLVKVTKDN